MERRGRGGADAADVCSFSSRACMPACARTTCEASVMHAARGLSASSSALIVCVHTPLLKLFALFVVMDALHFDALVLML